MLSKILHVNNIIPYKSLNSYGDTYVYETRNILYLLLFTVLAVLVSVAIKIQENYLVLFSEINV